MGNDPGAPPQATPGAVPLYWSDSMRWRRLGGVAGLCVALGCAGAGRVEHTKSEFEAGSIVVDLIRPGESTWAWRGIARGRVSREAAPDELAEIVARAVSEILDEFPPPPAD
jgi:hypothetical protein